MTGLLKQLFDIEEDFTYDPSKQAKGLELLLAAPNGRIMVAELNSVVIGMAAGQILISTAEGAPALVIEDVIVDAMFRQQGIGSTLLDALAGWGRSCGAGRMQLLADKKNHQALQFYRSQNWRETKLICLRKYHTA